MIDETQEPTSAEPPATPVTSVPPQPTASPAAPGLDPGIYAPDGKTWKSKYHGAEGTRMQVETARDQAEGRFTQQVQDLQQQLREALVKVTTLETQVQQLAAQTEAIPQLQGELDAAKQAAARANRLEVLMRHPDLLTVQVEETREVDGQPQTVAVNPFMGFIDSTTLEGDALDTMLTQMATALSVPPAAVVAPTPVTEGAAPQPAQPADTGGLDALRAEAMRWHQMKINAERGPNDEDPAEEERKAWQKFYQAQAATT